MDTGLKETALTIFNAALKSVDPFNSVINHLRVGDNLLLVSEYSSHDIVQYDLQNIKSIYVVGCGKAGAPMAAALENLLGDRIKGGLVVVRYDHKGAYNLSRISLVEAGHPEPDQFGYEAAGHVISLLEKAEKGDLVIAVISGGGSALWPLPAEQISLEDLKILSHILLSSGAAIYEMNVIRKHISLIQGGFAAAAAYPANVLALVLSDVIGDDPATIASGPFSPDPSTFSEAWGILDKYSLLNKIPENVREYFHAGTTGLLPETPKKDSKIFTGVKNCIVGSNKIAVNAAAEKALELGFKVKIVEAALDGEAKDTARCICNQVKKHIEKGEKGLCLISGGETTVTLSESHGLGGRNQELALAAAIELEGLDSVGMLSCGTDGTDGPTDAAGAFITGLTAGECRSIGLSPEDFLAGHDSYHLFEKLDALIKTGPTQTNVMDLQVVLIK